MFSIQYTSLNYGYPEKSHFAYKLEGLDKDWNYVQNERTATYRYLPAGDYMAPLEISGYAKAITVHPKSILTVIGTIK